MPYIIQIRLSTLFLSAKYPKQPDLTALSMMDVDSTIEFFFGELKAHVFTLMKCVPLKKSTKLLFVWIWPRPRSLGM
jgi:hypothetical protein